MTNTINYPFGKADVVEWEYDGEEDEVNGEVDNQFTYATVDEEIDSNFDLSLLPSPRLRAGAIVFLDLTAADGATTERTITLDDNVDGVNPTITQGNASGQRKLFQFVYDGEEFLLIGDTLITAAV